MPARQRKESAEDASTRALQAVEAITGAEPVEDASENIADPETRRLFIEARERDRRRLAQRD
jgi:hypothetical protein